MSGAKKIVHLSSVHRADDIRIFHKECRSLAKAGFDVTLIARGDRDESIDGVKIVAVKTSSSSRFTRMTRSVLNVLRKAIQENGDAYHFHDPELLPVGLILKARGKRVIYDSHEDIPGQIRTKYWLPPRLRLPVSLAVGLVESLSIRAFDSVVAATHGIAQRFPVDKTVVVQNFPLLEELSSGLRPMSTSRKQRIIYTGALTDIRGAREMVRAMERLGPEGVRMTLAGVIRPAGLEVELREMPGWRYVDFVGWQDRPSLVRLLSEASVGLVLFHPAPNHAESQPNKLFEYMSAGLPVVVSDFPFWAQFVEAPGTGLMVDPFDAAAIADAVLWLMEHPEDATSMGERGRQAVLERYSWEQEAKALVGLYMDERISHDAKSTSN